MNFAINLPINSTSFGNISWNICKELYARNLAPPYFPIGGVDLSAQKRDSDFDNWLENCARKAFKVHNRKNPTLKLWHSNQQSLESFSNDEIFITFLECDGITETEINILKNKKTVFVCSNYLKNILEEAGLNNVKYLQIGFDSNNFYVKKKKYYDDDRIVFLIPGKFEECRKRHKKTIQTWLKRFGVPRVGQRPKYFLHVAVYNPFLVRNVNGQMVDDNPRIFQECLNGKEYCNIQFFGWMQQNELYCDWLGSGHIMIGMSGSENIGLPEMHAVGLGKHGVILDATGYKDWANSENAVLIKPSGKIEAHDGIFFNKGGPLQQGSFYDWNEDEFIAGCEEAIKRVETSPINIAGLKIQERTYKHTVDTLLAEV